jgi:hypothetical protein
MLCSSCNRITEECKNRYEQKYITYESPIDIVKMHAEGHINNDPYYEPEHKL